jgi:adenylyltransferase/sulfurtransferase
LDFLSADEFQRYARQIDINEIGLKGQKRLKESSALVVGVGGLGSIIATLLALAGVGEIGLVDQDTVSLSNLQRQILYSNQDIGEKKVEAALRRIESQNPNVKIRIFDEGFTKENAGFLVNQYDVILDGTDNFSTRHLINEICVKQKKPYVFGAVDQFDGQVSVFWKDHGPCFSCLFPMKNGHDSRSDPQRINVLNTIVGIVGSLQANEAIKLLTGAGSPLIGELLLINILETRFHKITIPLRGDCQICGDLIL